MPRFSAKAKEIWDEIWYNTDIVKANELLEELKDPLDIAFGKLFIAYYYAFFQQQGEYLELLTEIENENTRLQDQFLRFIINWYYCMYYMGFNVPIVSKEQAEKYLDIIEQSLQDIDYKDDWEKYYCIGWYYLIKAWYTHVIKDDLSNAIKFQKKSIEVWSKIPDDGEYYSAGGHNTLGFYCFQNGDFKEAEKSLNLTLNACEKYNNLLQLWPLGNLSSINFLRGDLQKAKELIIQGLDVAKRFKNSFGIYFSLTRNGDYLYIEGKYDEAIKAHQESLKYRKQHDDPLQIFMGYFNIFNYYYQRLKLTTDKAFLTQAEQTLTDLQELSEKHADNKTMVNYTDYAQALIFKHGNIIKKGKAIMTLQELIEIYPNNIEFSLNLLELLFEDYLMSEDQDTIKEIDELMEKIGKVPLRNNPEAISSFLSQQIFLAKYIYYIKGDISVALNILHNTADHLKKFKLSNLEEKLNAETLILENELTKWENVDITIKERIKASEFNKYIQQALKYANQQK